MVVSPHRTKVDRGGLSLPPTLDNWVLNRNLSFKDWAIEDNVLQVSVNLDFPCIGSGQSDSDLDLQDGCSTTPVLKHPKHLDKLLSPRSVVELEEAATKLQKFYKSYRTRRNLADCAVIVEEFWWRTVDFATLKKSSVSFFNNEKPEPAASRWARAGRRAAKVGKGLSKDEKAQKLALRHWLEAIDPRHRYGHNLHMYYDVWIDSDSEQPFFYWLDIGDGKELNLPKCPRDTLQQQCIKYLGPNERENYEVIVRDGKLVYKKSGSLVNSIAGSKLIFVLSTSRKLYVGKKVKGKFQHSSFLAGGATTSAGRLVVQDGTLMAIWPYSGHYLPKKQHFDEFTSYLGENNVNLTNVQIGGALDEDLSFARPDDRDLHDVPESSSNRHSDDTASAEVVTSESDGEATGPSEPEDRNINELELPTTPEFTKSPSYRWATAAGARIGFVRDYPLDLQAMALEKVSLSPRPAAGGGSSLHPFATAAACAPTGGNKTTIRSPRPSTQVRCSPSVAYMGIPSPRVAPKFQQMVFRTPNVSLQLPPSRRRQSVV